MEINTKSKWIVAFCFAIPLLLTAGCNFNRKSDKQQGEIQDIMPTDTVFTASTDSVNPAWSHKLDSMFRVAATAKQDTNLAKLYYDIGEIYSNFDYAKAKEYYLKTGDLSKKLNWTEGRFLYSAGYTDILNREGSIDSSLVILQEILELEKKERNEKRIASVLANIGNCYNYKRWYETALNYYNEAISIFEKQGDKFRMAHLYSLMGAVYNRMKMYDEGVKYSEKSLEMLKEKPDTLLRVFALINYSYSFSSNYFFEKGEKALIEALRICNLNNNKYSLILIYNNLGNIALQKFDLNKAEMYARKTLELSLEFGDVENYCTANRLLSYNEKYKGNFDKSEEYIREALNTAIENDISEEKMDCYTQLADLETARHNFRSYKFYALKSDSIQNEMISEKTRIYAKELEAKYETAKKELKITALEKEKRLMSGLSIAGGAILLLALATFFLLWRWTIQKRKLAESKNKQLEQEKQLIATQAVLDGETQERSRLARDLHDGLGSMLTGVKLNLMEMKKGVKLEYPDVERFDNALGLLDDSVQEMRRVAHHLMPDSLSRFGLKPTVEDFCRSFAPTVVFDYFGDEARLDPMMEIVIYRSIHELVNNALKYSGASQILVQIMQEPSRIAFTVQDDGCGFDPSAETKGTGLQNIRDRIASFGGSIQIDSKAGEGTEVNGELKI